MPQIAIAQRRDPFESISKALSIAGSIYGIKGAIAQQQLAEQSMAQNKIKFEQGQEELSRQNRGEFTKGETAGLLSKGFEVDPTGKIGSFKANVTSDGQTNEVTFKTPGQVKSEIEEKNALALAHKLAQDQKKSKFEMEQGVRREYYTASKDTNEVLDGFNRVNTAGNIQNRPRTAADDMAMIFGYMKVLDPGSTVREGEYATARQATGVPGYIINLYNRAKDGTQLNQDQVTGFLQQAREQTLSKLERQLKTDQDFGSIASQYNLDARMILRPEYGQLYEQLKRGTNQNISQNQNPFDRLPSFETLAFGGPKKQERTPQQAIDEFLRSK